VLYEGLAPEMAVRELMSRASRAEMDALGRHDTPA
jgi:hypothetical protein